MATESPIRMMETSGKWPSHKEATTFASSSANMAAEEMGLLLNGRMLHGNGKDMIPNRSGSAPPSMEGSLVAIENLISHRRSIPNKSFAKLNSSKYDSKEQLHGDPAYLAHYSSNVNSNTRLTPSLISRENWRLVRHNGGFGNDWRLTSLDDSGNGSLRLSRGTLATHKEESEDDRSPQRSSSDLVDRSHELWSGQDLALLAGQQRSSVVSMTEDLPHTPSRIYNQSLSVGHGISEHTVDLDSDYGSFNGVSVGTSNPVTFGSIKDDVASSSCADLSTDQVSSSFVFKHTGNATSIPSFHNGESKNVNFLLQDDVTVSNVAAIESEMNALHITSLPISEDRKYQEELLHKNHHNLAQNQVHQQQSNTFQVQSASAQSQMIFQGVNHSYFGMENFVHGPTKFSAEVLPVFQTSGATPPLYATAAAFMNPSKFYPNLQPSSLFPHQYGLGEYALNTAVPPFIAGYPPHGAIPFAYDGVAAPTLNARMPGVSSVGSIAPGVDAQHLDKSYGHPGFALQPSFVDPLHMQYFQHPFWDAYAFSSHLDPLASGGAVIGSQMSVLDKQKGSDGVAYSHDQKLQHQRSGVVGSLNQRGGTMGSNYFGGPVNMGIMMQHPSSPLARPVLPGSPVAGTCLPRGKNEMRFVQAFGRNSGLYPGWPGQGGVESFVDPKAYSFLEELKSGKWRRFELCDIAGHIVEFSADQHGSRFIQQKLENCSIAEKASVFKEVLPQASKLMTDVFGNYVIQKFFEYGSPDQRKELANQLAGQILPLSMQMYGCRVIQKALEVIDLDQKTKIVRELDGHVMRCVRDQNGNHVIQKCIESLPLEKIGFIISAFRGHVATLSTHPYGCRVIQRVLEHCTGNLHSPFIVDEILESVCALAKDQYGNYVTQHVLERGKPHERCQIIRKLSGQIVQLSQHKFASNVIEKCLEHGDKAERELLIREVVGHNEENDNLLMMMKDQFANYVVQKVLEMCSDSQREILLSRIKVHINALKKYTYGKHIVARFEQLFGEELQTSGDYANR